MKVRFSNKFPNEFIDDVLTRWLCLYIVAREKCGNFNYDDKYKVVKDYIVYYYEYDYTQYIIDLLKSEDLKDENELLAIRNCEKFCPLGYWIDLKTTFDINEEYFEERLKYNYDKIMKQIKNEIECVQSRFSL